MTRLFWFILLIAILASFYFGWFAVSSSTDPGNAKSKIEFSVDKSKVKKDTSEVINQAKNYGQKIKDEHLTAPPKQGSEPVGSGVQLTLDPQSIVLEEGAQAEVVATRSGADLKTLQLGLHPSSGSQLLASGGLFKTYETSTPIMVSAPKGAGSGNITIESGGHAQILVVTVKP